MGLALKRQNLLSGLDRVKGKMFWVQMVLPVRFTSVPKRADRLNKRRFWVLVLDNDYVSRFHGADRLNGKRLWVHQINQKQVANNENCADRQRLWVLYIVKRG